MLCLAPVLLLASAALAAEPPVIIPARNADPDGTVGKRPYEMVWAKRRPAHAELVDFENLDGWTTASFLGAEATLTRSRQEQMFGSHTARADYTGKNSTSYFELRPPKPIAIPGEPTAVQLWVRGNNWGWHPKPQTARTHITIVVHDAKGEAFDIRLGTVNFDYWSLMHATFVFPPAGAPPAGSKPAGGFPGRAKPGENLPQDSKPAGGVARLTARCTPVRGTGDGKIDYPLSFVCIRVSGCSDKRPAKLSFDSLQFYAHAATPLPELKLPPKDVPWPTTPDTITPIPKNRVTNTAHSRDGGFEFTAVDVNDRIRWIYRPKTGTLSDLTVEIGKRRFQPCAEGGPVFDLGGQDVRVELLSQRLDGDTAETRWRASRGAASVEYTMRLRAKDKSLQITVTEHTDPFDKLSAGPKAGGKATAFRIGRTKGTPDADVFRVPYLTLGNGPHLVHWNGIFLSALLDWYNSDASTLFVEHGNHAKGEYVYNGGSRYLPKTDGLRNPLRERLIVTVSTDFHEVLPHIPHPKSDTAHLAKPSIWRNIGSPNEDLLKRLKARGVENFICPLHEVGWRDAGESFTFRLRCAPRIGDAKMIEYGKFVKSLGYRFGLYANYTDFAPVNGNWREDRVCLQPDGNWTGAWPRCYAPKPTYAWQAEAHFAPRIAAKFGANTCYSDVHTAVAPWGRTDYDARSPGAGMFRTAWACYAQVLWNESPSYHNGPIFSEGSYQWLYAGISDGNYGQMNGAGGARWRRPPLVDFDLLKMHPLMCDFGMGMPSMFFPRHGGKWRGRTPHNEYFDRFITSTLAFGHIGFLALDWGFEGALKSYYMTNAVQQRYALVPVEEIRYFDGEKLLTPSDAIRTGAYKRGQVYVRYTNGLELWCNLSFEHNWKLGDMVLPPTGHKAVNRQTQFFQFSAPVDGKRIDYAGGPQYFYLDTRGVFFGYGEIAGRGALAVKPLAGEPGWWVIPAETCQNPTLRIGGVAMTATAYDIQNKPIGRAEVRLSNLGATVLPVKGAYRHKVLRGAKMATPAPDRQVRRLVAGLEYAIGRIARGFAGDDLKVTSVQIERVGSDGKVMETTSFPGLDKPATIRVPGDVKHDERLWYRLRIRGKVGSKEQERIGWFTGLASRAIDIDLQPAAAEPQKPDSRQKLHLELRSNLPDNAIVSIAADVPALRLRPRIEPIILRPRKEHTVVLDYTLSGEPALVPITLTLMFPQGKQTVKRWLRVTESQATVVNLAKLTPTHIGMAFRGKAEEPLDTARTGGQFYAARRSVGGMEKEGFFCHPPYKGGVGYAFAEFQVKLPDAPCALETFVGFSDGSTTQDGCVFSVEVKAGDKLEAVAKLQHATLEKWKKLTVDLSKYRGKTVTLRLTTDVGPKDNSYSDWACWGEPRVVLAGDYLLPKVHEKRIPLPIGPPRIPLKGLKPHDLKSIVEAKLFLDGAGVDGGKYRSDVYLNGVLLGHTPPSRGDTVWAELQSIAVPAEALKTIGPRNAVVIRNPRRDCMKVRAVHLWFKLADGRIGTSVVVGGPFCSDRGWLHAEGQTVPLGNDLPAIQCHIPVAKE